MTASASITTPYGGPSPMSVDAPASEPPSFIQSILHPGGAPTASLLDIGIFKDTLLPSLALHSSFSLVAYAAGRATNCVETKDWLWPAGQVTNAWWSAAGRRLAAGVPASVVFASLSRPERLLLAGVSLWGGRLLYRVASRTVRRGKDDPRYDALKKEEGFWNKALFSLYLPEALFQTVISLPFTAPFRHQGAALTGYHPVVQGVAVALFGAGFAMEILADWQLDTFKEKNAEAKSSMCRDGVWSLVRHPNYLGDMLVHLSFPLLLYSCDMVRPIELLGPLANYLFLRQVSGDKENEQSQEERYAAENPEKRADLESYRRERNAFWPDASQVSNKWAWIVVGCGVAAAVVERGVNQVFFTH